MLEKLCCARDKYSEVVNISKTGNTEDFWNLLIGYHLQLGLCRMLGTWTTLNDMNELIDEIISDTDRYFISKSGYWFDIAIRFKPIMYNPITTQLVVENCLLPRLDLLNKTIKRLES